MRSLILVPLLLAGCPSEPDATCPVVDALGDAPPCAAGACPAEQPLSCDDPWRIHASCQVPGGPRYAVEVVVAEPETRVFRTDGGDAVAVSVAGDFGDGCPVVRWWGADLSGCLVDDVERPACDTDVVDSDTDGGDTDPDTDDTDLVDTDTDLPGTCFLTPLEDAPFCGGSTCANFSTIDPCAVPHLGDPQVGTCALGGHGQFDVVRWIAPDGTEVTAFGTPFDRLAAWVEDPALPTCRRWWGEDLSGCDTLLPNTLVNVDCDTDVPDTDTDTDTTVETGLLLDTAGGWPIAWTDPGDLVVTELHVDPDGCVDLAGEFVEIRNVGPHPIDLKNLVLTNDVITSRVLRSYRLARGAYAVGARAGRTCDASQVIPDFGWAATESLLPDEGGLLRLRRFDGVDLDVVDFTTWRFDPVGLPDFVVPIGHTIQVKAGSETAAGNDDPAHWCAGADLFPDPDTGDGVFPVDNYGSPAGPTTSCLVP